MNVLPEFGARNRTQEVTMVVGVAKELLGATQSVCSRNCQASDAALF